MKKLIFSLLILCVAGCQSPTDPAVISKNKTVLSGKGTEIGKLPDGRKVVRYEVSRGTYDPHWIYVCGDTVSVNYSVKQGKGHRTETIVIIDGVKYVPLEKQE